MSVNIESHSFIGFEIDLYSYPDYDLSKHGEGSLREEFLEKIKSKIKLDAKNLISLEIINNGLYFIYNPSYTLISENYSGVQHLNKRKLSRENPRSVYKNFEYLDQYLQDNNLEEHTFDLEYHHLISIF